MTGAERIAEAAEGIEYVRQEIAAWVTAVDERDRAGAHLTRLAKLQEILGVTLNAIAAKHAAAAARPLDLSGAYVLASTTDKRVLFCRRLFRWYALRFDQRAEESLGCCLAGADEVVWSTWERTFAAAGTPPGPAPLCFVDNDPIPWTNRQGLFPPETAPPASDDFFTSFVERTRGLPIPVIGLPPVVARRPWWLVIAIHETGHHVYQALANTVGESLAAAAGRACARPSEQGQWKEWSSELFADAFASAFAGGAAAWAVAELEQACPDPYEARLTYPPPEVRLRIVSALVANVGGSDPGCTLTGGAPAANPKASGLLKRVDAIVTALLDHPIGRTTLRELAGDGQALAEAQARWAADLRAGAAYPSQRVEAAAACVGGAVRAWQEGDQTAPAALRAQVLAVLPQCRPVGTRAAGPDDAPAAAQVLIDTVLDPGAPL